MPRRFYVVWVGRNTGVFTSWSDTKKQVHEFPQAEFKSFRTKEEAESAFMAGRGALSKRSAQNPSNDARKAFDTEIYCDGACDPNPGKAGSGVAVYRESHLSELWYGLYNPRGTNNSAELNALYQALRIAKEDIDQGHEVQILCDSRYSISCVTSWAFSWEKKGWKRKAEAEIKNLKIIQQAHELYKDIRAKVVVSHVKAHMGIEGNELADRMAAFGIDQQAANLCRYTGSLEIKTILKFRTS